MIKQSESKVDIEDIIEFSDSKTDEYKQLIEEQFTKKTTTIVMADDDEDEINIDDI